MVSLSNIIIICAGLATYGYLLSRKIRGLAYTVLNLVAGVVAILIARNSGASWQDLGLDPVNPFVGLAIGLVGACLVLAVSYGIFRWAGGRKLRIGRGQWPDLFFRIPLGTALAEELIFRGAILGMLLTRYSQLKAMFISSIIFGLWHLLPGPLNNWAHTNLANSVGSAWRRYSLSSLGTVGFTTLAGLLFSLLRLWSGGLVAPWLVHAATNIAGTIANQSLSSKHLLKFSAKSAKVSYNKGQT